MSISRTISRMGFGILIIDQAGSVWLDTALILRLGGLLAGEIAFKAHYTFLRGQIKDMVFYEFS